MLSAELVIDLFGGAAVLADEIGYNRTTVWRWTQPRDRQGTGGYVPTQAVNKVMAAARENGIDLSGAIVLEEGW